MSRNGSGVYSPSATGYPAVASTTIESAKYNAVVADIATALTGSIACNGESTITGNIPLAGYKLTGIGNASAGGDAVNLTTGDARYAVLSGPTFTGSVTVSTTQPIYWLTETDGASNEKKWAIQGTAGGFYISAFNDAADTATNAISVSRNGVTINTISLAATTVTINSIDVTPTQGSFTVYLRATNDGANLTSGTANWTKSQGIVTLQLPGLVATTAATDPLFVDGLPAAIVPVTVAQYLLAPGYDGGAETAVQVTVPVAGDYLTIRPFNSSVFAGGSSSKGMLATTLTWKV